MPWADLQRDIIEDFAGFCRSFDYEFDAWVRRRQRLVSYRRTTYENMLRDPERCERERRWQAKFRENVKSDPIRFAALQQRRRDYWAKTKEHWKARNREQYLADKTDPARWAKRCERQRIYNSRRKKKARP